MVGIYKGVTLMKSASIVWLVGWSAHELRLRRIPTAITCDHRWAHGTVSVGDTLGFFKVINNKLVDTKNPTGNTLVESN